MTEQRTEAATRPIWQSTPCPDWCTSRHHDMDDVAGRECGSLYGIVPLTTEDTLLSRTTPEAEAQLDTVHVGLEQGFREIAPRVTLYRANGQGFGMTLEEAEILDEHLQHFIATGRGEITR